MTDLKLIMIVDDDVDDRLFFTNAVQQMDPSIRCLEAENGEQALATLKTLDRQPDYIFLDLNMPLMNGIEFLSLIITYPAWRSIPVIIYTTSVSEKDMLTTREMGAKFYLPKTGEISKLPAKIAFAINMVDTITVD